MGYAILVFENIAFYGSVSPPKLPPEEESYLWREPTKGSS